jgi:hypothetical protein
VQLEVVEEILEVNTEGCVIVITSISEHPFASVTVTLNVPAHSPVAVPVVCPPVHAYVKGAVPPVGVELTDASQFPAQVTLLLMVALAANVFGAVSVIV